MQLSDIGKVVDQCWMEIPQHFKNTRLDTYQVMPNHVHGIVEIRDKQTFKSLGGDVACNVSTEVRHGYFSEISPKPGDLGTTIRSFKAAVTAKVHEQGLSSESTIWQSRFHDHIVRDDRSRFFIELYIELNPIMWYLDSDNPKARALSPDALRAFLREKHGIDGYLLEHIVQFELSYRVWKKEPEGE